MTKTLQLHFNTSGDKKVMLTVDEPQANLTEEQVNLAMQEIIESGIFIVDDYPLERIISARIVERTLTQLIEA